MDSIKDDERIFLTVAGIKKSSVNKTLQTLTVVFCKSMCTQMKMDMHLSIRVHA